MVQQADDPVARAGLERRERALDGAMSCGSPVPLFRTCLLPDPQAAPALEWMVG
jgi:hypothetical protein